MEWHVNELSLDGQYTSEEEFIKTITPLLITRNKYSYIAENFYISSKLGSRPAIKNKELRKVLYHLTPKYRSQKTQLLKWLDKKGPFNDTDLIWNNDDSFWFNDLNVTNSGIGEASRRKQLNLDAASFSFLGSRIDFSADLLKIVHKYTNNSITFIQIQNYTDTDEIENALISVTSPPDSRPQVYEEMKLKYENLTFSLNVFKPMLSSPFSPSIYRNIHRLINTLNILAGETDESGATTKAGKELYENYFRKKKLNLFMNPNRTSLILKKICPLKILQIPMNIFFVHGTEG